MQLPLGLSSGTLKGVVGTVANQQACAMSKQGDHS